MDGFSLFSTQPIIVYIEVAPDADWITWWTTVVLPSRPGQVLAT